MKQKIFRQIRNDEKDIEAVADGYKTKIRYDLWLVEGLQKDAIQNSWDARVSKKDGKGWECGFSLIELNNKKFFRIIDRGTTGLNGTIFHTERELVKILSKNEPGEDLAYFLNSNWSAKSIEAGGNRGRGKTLFLAASQDKKIFFDSFRASDNIYVFGELYLDKDKQVKFRLDYEDNAKKAFKEFTKGNEFLLNQYGTRIFISNPDSAIEKAMKSGEALSFMSYSWWEIIKKYQAKIFVENGDEKKYVIVPYWYNDKLENIQEREIRGEKIKEGTFYKTKKLVLRYTPDLSLPDAIRGIAIQRGGMTVERLWAEELVHEEGMTDIYGWLEMEFKPLEEEMKRYCEGPEHLDFSWNTSPAKYLKDYIRYKIREFAKELKIIESEQIKKNKIQKAAEEEALRSLTPLFKKLGLLGKHKGGKKPRDKFKRSKNEPLRLSMPDIQFPREIKRVNYGEEIKKPYVVPINDFNKSILVLVQIFISSNDGKNEIIGEKEINLRPGRGHKIGPEVIKISNNYTKGGYSLRARMVSLEEKNKMFLSDGTKIEKGTVIYDRINKKFYVETDPPESGPFNFQPRGRDKKNYLFEWEPEENNGYIIFYNDLHPRIKIILDDAEKLKEYFTEQGALIALQIKLEELMVEDDKEDEELHKLIKLNKNPNIIWPTFLKKYSDFLWDLKKEDGNKNTKKR